MSWVSCGLPTTVPLDSFTSAYYCRLVSFEHNPAHIILVSTDFHSSKLICMPLPINYSYCFQELIIFFFFFKQWNTTSLSGYYISKWAHITLASLFILYFSICSAPLCSNIILTFKLCLKFTRVIVCTKNYLHCLDVMTTATKKKPKKNKQKQLLNLHYQ